MHRLEARGAAPRLARTRSVQASMITPGMQGRAESRAQRRSGRRSSDFLTRLVLCLDDCDLRDGGSGLGLQEHRLEPCCANSAKNNGADSDSIGGPDAWDREQDKEEGVSDNRAEKGRVGCRVRGKRDRWTYSAAGAHCGG